MIAFIQDNILILLPLCILYLSGYLAARQSCAGIRNIGEFWGWGEKEPRTFTLALFYYFSLTLTFFLGIGWFLPSVPLLNRFLGIMLLTTLFYRILLERYMKKMFIRHSEASRIVATRHIFSIFLKYFIAAGIVVIGIIPTVAVITVLRQSFH